LKSPITKFEGSFATGELWSVLSQENGRFMELLCGRRAMLATCALRALSV